jgi:competence protein ComEC
MPYAILITREWLAERIEVAAHDHVLRGVLRGLAVGDTGAISTEQWRVFSATGTTHLLAISGLHISMVATLFAWLGGRLTRTSFGQRRRWTRLYGETIGGLAGAIGYSLLAGLSTPTERTLAMLCVFFVSRALRRNLGVGHSIGLTLVAVLLIDPFAPLSVGAWLSFGAVVAIVAAMSGTVVPGGMLATFARTQWAVTIGMLPVLALAFGSLSLVSPLANALAVPLFTIVLVPLTLLGALVATFSLPLGSLILGFAAQLLEWCWPLFDWLSHLGVAVWHFPALSWPTVAALGIGAGLALLPGPRLGRFAGCALCVPAFLAPASTLKPGEFSVSMLDVGQGLSLVVRTSAHALVYDAGPKFRSGRDTGELVVVPYLHSVGLSALDLFIASHGDQDHVGGARSLFEQVRVKAVLAGPSAKGLRPDARLCIQGSEWEWDGVRFRVLSPGAELAERDNDSSCVVAVVGSGGTVLLTGDIEKTAETLLLEAPVNLNYLEAGVVTMPHHGSKTSSTPEFVAATHARYALASAGYRNRWGFPKPDVTARWQASGAVTYCTSESGAVEIDVLVRGIQPPREYRIEHPRYWRARQGVSIRGK